MGHTTGALDTVTPREVPTTVRPRTTSTSVARAVLVFALSGVVALALVGIAGVVVLRRVGTDEATREAERIATVAARGIVEPRLQNGIVKGDADALATLDTLVTGAIVQGSIVRVKLWTPEGEIVYSDAPELIGSRFDLDETERQALRGGGVAVERGDPAAPESRLERELGPLLVVSMPVHTPDGRPLLFQAALPSDSVADSGRRLWSTFWPVLAVALAALALLQIPLAWRLARRVRESQRDRELLLRRAIDSSDLERRRIAGDLHDGPVQQLAGLSMSLSAQADALAHTDPGAARTLREAASRSRQGMRSLRSALMGIYPPTLRRAGLPAALSDLVAPLAAEGIVADLDVDIDEGGELPPEVESLLFRASQEAIRNVRNHAHASRVDVRVRTEDGRAMLEVADDGGGFAPERERAARADGHVGLVLLRDLAGDAGGALDVTSSPGEGTRLRLEVPLP